MAFKYMLSPRGSRKYEKLAAFLKKGSRMSPDDIFIIARSLINSLYRLHTEGLVCDYITPNYVILCLDNSSKVQMCELVATTEYPKWDLHEWRQQRDVHALGEVLQQTMLNMAPSMSKRKLTTRGLSLKSFSMAL